MPNFDTRPTVVNIDHYAGDTLPISITIPDAVVAGRTWRAQVRKERLDPVALANFVIIPRANGADVILETADCARLAADGVFKGYWDVQLSAPDGSDPVTTLAHGYLRIHLDVTRGTP
jgi:hypothetical protein